MGDEGKIEKENICGEERKEGGRWWWGPRPRFKIGEGTHKNVLI